MSTSSPFVDRLPVSIVLVRDDGSEPRCNEAFSSMLDAEPESRRLADACTRLATALLAVDADVHSGATSIIAPPLHHRFSTASAEYRLTGSLCPDPLRSDRQVATVVVDRAAVHTAEGARHLLRDRFRLTQREAEVALLVVDGLTNREIADKLDISIHTANRHAEHLLQKMQARSRTSAARAVSTLLADVRPL